MRTIGSQKRETLKESGYTFISDLGNNEVCLSDENGKLELWVANDDHAGYTIEIDGVGYEFVSSR